MKNVLCTVVLVLALATAVGAEQRFVDNGDGTVTDTHTGLMWADHDNGGDLDWEQAGRWVRYTFADTIPARYDDWRLPTREELLELYAASGDMPRYQTECGYQLRSPRAIVLTCAWLWADGGNGITARTVNLGRGVSYTDRKTTLRGRRVLPVRDAR